MSLQYCVVIEVSLLSLSQRRYCRATSLHCGLGEVELENLQEVDKGTLSYVEAGLIVLLFFVCWRC